MMAAGQHFRTGAQRKRENGNTVHKSTIIDTFYLYVSYPSDVTAHGGHRDAYTLHIVIAPYVFQRSCTNYSYN